MTVNQKTGASEMNFSHDYLESGRKTIFKEQLFYQQSNLGSASFYTHLKHQKRRSFTIISGSMERDQWHEIVWAMQCEF